MIRSNIFISYSPKDEVEKERLLAHLSILRAAGLGVTLSGANRTEKAESWQPAIPAAITEANLAILLISPDYFASPFLMETELPALLEQSGQHNLVLQPLVIKSCAWQLVNWLQELEVRPRTGQPVWAGSDREADQLLAAFVTELAYIISPEVGL